MKLLDVSNISVIYKSEYYWITEHYIDTYNS